ncbi:3218_t:CDS:2, partial [Rhizophagus irregularis]
AWMTHYQMRKKKEMVQSRPFGHSRKCKIKWNKNGKRGEVINIIKTSAIRATSRARTHLTHSDLSPSSANKKQTLHSDREGLQPGVPEKIDEAKKERCIKRLALKDVVTEEDVIDFI